jgi:DNA-binding transcriptional LysR family regulator
MQEAAAGIARAAAGGNLQARGTVRITAGEALGTQVLPSMLAGLMAREPALQIELVVSDAVDNLLQREADIAVRLMRPQQDDVIARRIGVIELGVFAHERYLARHDTPKTLGGGVTRVGYDRNERDLRALAARGQRFRRTDFQFRSDSVLAQQAAIEAGIGVGAVLVPIARDRPGLVRLYPQLSFPLELWLCAHDDLRRSATLRRVYDELGAALDAAFGQGAPATATNRGGRTGRTAP